MNQKPTAGAAACVLWLENINVGDATQTPVTARHIDAAFVATEDTATVALCRAWLERNP